MAIENGNVVPLVLVIVTICNVVVETLSPNGEKLSNPLRSWVEAEISKSNDIQSVRSRTVGDLLDTVAYVICGHFNPFEQAVSIKQHVIVDDASVVMDAANDDYVKQGTSWISDITAHGYDEDKASPLAYIPYPRIAVLEHHIIKTMERLHKALKELFPKHDIKEAKWRPAMVKVIKTAGFTDFPGIIPDEENIINEMHNLPPTPLAKGWVDRVNKLSAMLVTSAASCAKSTHVAGSVVSLTAQNVKTVLDRNGDNVLNVKMKRPTSLVSFSLPIKAKREWFAAVACRSEADEFYREFRTALACTLLDYLEDFENKSGSFEPGISAEIAYACFNKYLGTEVRLIADPQDDPHNALILFKRIMDAITVRAKVALDNASDRPRALCEVYLSAT